MTDPLKGDDYPKSSDSDEAFFNKLEQYQKRSLFDSDRVLTLEDSGMRPDSKLNILDYVAAYYFMGANRKFHLKYRLHDDMWDFYFPFNIFLSPFVFVQMLMEVVNLLVVYGLSTVVGNEAFLINRFLLCDQLFYMLTGYSSGLHSFLIR